jgi:hypothetical protein
MNLRCIIQRWYTYKSEYLREFETEFENILGCESGAHMGKNSWISAVGYSADSESVLSDTALILNQRCRIQR